MANLTAKQESFINLMTESEELARRGFELLLKRPDFEKFFDPLKEAGLFDARCNPAPEPAEKEGYFRIPYWSALDYLKALAKLSGENSDLALANKVMDVVRSVSNWRGPDGQNRENYHTSHKFAEIFGLVPTAAVTPEDLGLITIWLSDKFDRGLVGVALGEGAMAQFLASPAPDDWEKAVVVLGHCTAIRWRPAERFGERVSQPTTAVEDFWLKQLIDRHASLLGEKIGKKATQVFLERVREIFSSESRRLSSSLYRPAIEDNSQNHEWHGAENRTVEGLRDVLLSWCEHHPEDASPFVASLLGDEMEIVRRVGIYILAKRWIELQPLYAVFLGSKVFDSGHLHELYNLLKEHFADLSDEEKARTVAAIKEIPTPTWGADPVRSLKRIQQQWLSAIVGKGYLPADEWFEKLQGDPAVGRLSDHPDFDSYMEGWVGPGPSPYSIQELVAFAEAGVVVAKLDSFEPRDAWKGPTMDGLVSAFGEAVQVAPEAFLRILSEFLNAKRAFQLCVIESLKKAWETAEGAQTEVDWKLGWEKLITFFEQLIDKPDFWGDKGLGNNTSSPPPDWIASAIAGFLHAGTRKDEHAFSIELFPRTWSLIKILLDKASAADQPSDDAMFQAINSPKGKAVEALFSQALRSCRMNDKTNGSHGEAWGAIKPLFETELDKCKNANYEFSTLAGAYLPQLEYMDREWAKSRIDHIFPSAFPFNGICAIDGLAYAQFTRSIYALLAKSGALDRGLRYELKGNSAREKLLERIAAAYLWGEDTLESSRFSYLFETGSADDLEVITRVFWSVRDSEPSGAQRQRVLDYWERCLAWKRDNTRPPARLLSALSTLSSYLPSADGKARELLEAVAPHVHDGPDEYSFFEGLARLVEVSPDGVSIVLRKAIEARVPVYDYKDRLKSLLQKLAEKGMKEDVLLYANRLRNLPGMEELFESLSHKH